jgi:hypothetical protein
MVVIIVIDHNENHTQVKLVWVNFLNFLEYKKDSINPIIKIIKTLIKVFLIN